MIKPYSAYLTLLSLANGAPMKIKEAGNMNLYEAMNYLSSTKAQGDYYEMIRKHQSK